MDDRDAAGIIAKLGYGVERHAIVGHIDGGRHDHGARRADALLERRYCGTAALVCMREPGRERGKALRLIDVHVAIEGIRGAF